MSQLNRLRYREEPVPTGWKTGQQIASELNVGKSHTNKILKELIDSRKAKRKMFKLYSGGYLRAIPHYKINL